MKRLRHGLFIAIIWILIVGLGLEIGLRLFAYHIPARFNSAVQYVLENERYRITILEYMTTDSEHGYVLRPDLENVTQRISANETFNFSTRRLWGSRFGFRTRPIDYRVEVAVVGDSFSFCFTQQSDCWVDRFERETGLGTVNLAQPATASVSHLNMLRTFAQPLAPRLVIWQFFGNDFNEDYGLAVLNGDQPDIGLPSQPDATAPPIIRWLRRNSLAFAVGEVALGNSWPYLTDGQRMFIPAYHAVLPGGLLTFGQDYERYVMNMELPQNRIGYDYTKNALREAQLLVNTWGGRLVILLIPTREQVYAHITAPIMGPDQLAVYDNAYTAMRDLCRELTLTCFDLLPQLQTAAQQGQMLYYAEDLHLNAAGNAVLAELLWGWLGGQGLLYE